MPVCRISRSTVVSGVVRCDYWRQSEVDASQSDSRCSSTDEVYGGKLTTHLKSILDQIKIFICDFNFLCAL